MSASSASHRIVRFDFGKDGLRRAAFRLPVPPAFRTLPHNASIECLVMAPKAGPLAGTLIAVSERGLDANGNIQGFLIGGATRGTLLAASAPTTSTSAIAR